jgi:hypothetical protein
MSATVSIVAGPLLLFDSTVDFKDLPIEFPFRFTRAYAILLNALNSNLTKEILMKPVFRAVP